MHLSENLYSIFDKMNKITCIPLKFCQIVSKTRLEMPLIIDIFQQKGNKNENISCDLRKNVEENFSRAWLRKYARKF